MAKFIINTGSSLKTYFKQGQVFGVAKNNATVFECKCDAEKTVACLKNVGIVGFVEELVTSYAVVYIRKGEGERLLKGLGKNPANPNAGQVDPSKRRFATRDEADQHGSRFRSRKANANDADGSAGHEGFFVVETSDPVNAKINWKTGLTNPV